MFQEHIKMFHVTIKKIIVINFFVTNMVIEILWTVVTTARGYVV